MKKVILLSALFILFSYQSFAGTDYSSTYLMSLCAQKNTEKCEGYLFATLDILQSDFNKNKDICICSRDTLCGMSALDTKKLPPAFVKWAKKNRFDGSTSAAATKFIDETFSCNRPNPNDFIKAESGK